MGSTSVRRGAWTLAGFAVMEGALAAPACDTSAPSVLLERFVAADCESCWQNASEPAARTMVLDWITPTSDAAPLAAAALPEAGTRAGAAPGNETMLRESRLTRPDAPRVRISDGPAWNGYIGLQLTVHKRGRLFAGAVGYVALVERVSAGSEGSSVARQLVRAVAGPLVLDELASQPVVQHVRAVRVPPGSRADHLASVGWVETAQGTVIAAAQTPMAGCTPRR